MLFRLRYNVFLKSIDSCLQSRPTVFEIPWVHELRSRNAVLQNYTFSSGGLLWKQLREQIIWLKMEEGLKKTSQKSNLFFLICLWRIKKIFAWWGKLGKDILDRSGMNQGRRVRLHGISFRAVNDLVWIGWWQYRK